MFDENNLKGWIRDEVRSVALMKCLPFVCVLVYICVLLRDKYDYLCFYDAIKAIFIARFYSRFIAVA